MYIPKWLIGLLLVNLILVGAFTPHIIAPQIIGSLILCGIVGFIRSKTSKKEEHVGN